MATNVYQQLNQAQIDYNYGTRVILLAEAFDADQDQTKLRLDEILFDSYQNKYIIKGVAAQFGTYVLMQLEGKFQDIKQILLQLQLLVQRWSGLEPNHPVSLQSKNKQQLFKKTVVLLFEENVKYSLPYFRHFILKQMLKCDISMQQTLQQQIVHTVAATLKITSLTNLCANMKDQEEYQTSILRQTEDDLPNMQNLSKILKLPESSEGYVNKYQNEIKNYDQHFSKQDLDIITANEEKYEQYLKEDGVFAVQCDEVIELDEFVQDLLLCNKVDLIEEVGNLNENWVYENLKHILDKKQ